MTADSVLRPSPVLVAASIFYQAAGAKNKHAICLLVGLVIFIFVLSFKASQFVH